jgi:hypothetical protein
MSREIYGPYSEFKRPLNYVQNALPLRLLNRHRFSVLYGSVTHKLGESLMFIGPRIIVIVEE